MGSSDCGVLSSRGWAGRLELSLSEGNNTPTQTVNEGSNCVTLSSTNMTVVLTNICSNTSNHQTSTSTNLLSPSNNMTATGTSSDTSVDATMTTSMESTGGGALGRGGRGRASPAPLNRVPLLRQSEDRRARRCRFYRNGDRWFPGALLAVSSDRHRTWDSVLCDLTRLLEHPLHLAAGVRYVFSLDGLKVETLEQLADSGEYVASSTDTFKVIDYRAARLPQWRLHTRRREALHVPSSTVNALCTVAAAEVSDEATSNVRSRIVTVVRNGQRPRKAVRVLLNRRTARSLDQVMEDLSISLQLDTGAVRKLYTVDGRQVMNVRELMQAEDVFIACGAERIGRDDLRLHHDELRGLQPRLLRGAGGGAGGGVAAGGPRRRMASPKPPRGDRALSPLVLPHDHQTGSLPRGSRLSRESPGPGYPRPPSASYPSFPSTEDLFLPAAITSRYRVGRVLGDGNFAVVRECSELGGRRRQFALKIIDKAKCLGKEDMIQSEVDILRKVNHENIVGLEEELHCPDYLYLVMELITGGDLFDAIAAATRYTEAEAGHLVRDLAAALSYLHHRNIVHRDVKPENLLVVPGKMPRLKLGDFGLAVELTEPLYTICGTPTYVAPEILSEVGYGMQVDIWAAGVIAYILLCGFPPFISATNNQEELFEQILAGHLSFPAPYWEHVGPLPRRLIAAMVRVDPTVRYTAHLVLQHPWIMQCQETPQGCGGDGARQSQRSNSGADGTSDRYDEVSGDEQLASSAVLSPMLPPLPVLSNIENMQQSLLLHEEANYNLDQHLDNPEMGDYFAADVNAVPGLLNRTKSPCKSPNRSNNSVSSSSGIDSFASSNDNKCANIDTLSLIVVNDTSNDLNKIKDISDSDKSHIANRNIGNSKNNGNPTVRRGGDGTECTSPNSRPNRGRKSRSPAKRSLLVNNSSRYGAKMDNTDNRSQRNTNGNNSARMSMIPTRSPRDAV